MKTRPSVSRFTIISSCDNADRGAIYRMHVHVKHTTTRFSPSIHTLDPVVKVGEGAKGLSLDHLGF